ncbi:MAG TPA: hypothetical protein VLH86_04260 [Patescibacteria group bacterium]|nr:hypothetical protein [Patescibacteria group bacterium]
MNNKQKGFGAVEILTAIIILVLIGFTGWYLLNHKYTAGKTPASTSQSSTNAKTCSASDTSQYCIELAAAERTTFSKLPAELQQVAVATISAQVPACVKDGKLVDFNGKFVDPPVTYASVGSALIGIGCDGGSSGLFAKNLKDGQWKFVEKTQFAFTCGAVFNNPVPKKLLELATGKAECVDSASKLQPYDTAASRYFL